MDHRPEPPPKSVPWFIEMDGPRPRLRWRLLLTRFLLLVGLQVLLCLAINYWSCGQIRAARVGAIVLPMGAMVILIMHRAYQAAFPEQHPLSRGQVSLFALLILVSLFCVWLTLVRLDYQWERSWYAQREDVKNQLDRLVGGGRVRWSGNQPKLFVSVKRQDFSDADLQRITHVVESIAPRGSGIYFLDLCGTSITDEGLQNLWKCRELEYLLLDKCVVSDRGLRVVEELPQLKLLSLKQTGVTQAWLYEIGAKRPDLVIEPKQTELSDQ